MWGEERERFEKDMDDEEVGWAVEGDDLALELLSEGGLRGDHDPDRKLLAAGLHAAAAAARVVDGVEADRELRVGALGNSARNSGDSVGRVTRENQ